VVGHFRTGSLNGRASNKECGDCKEQEPRDFLHFFSLLTIFIFMTQKYFIGGEIVVPVCNKKAIKEK
jgi:hypothetical protein